MQKSVVGTTSLFLALSLRPFQAACAQMTQPVSPQAVATAYVNGLAADRLDVIWSYDINYALELEAATRSLPKSLWPEKTQELRLQHREMFNRERAQPIPFGTGNCWAFFRPKVSVTVLETRPRQSDFSGDTSKYWQVFVRANYQAEADAPPVATPGGSRRLREVLVRFTVVQRQAARQLYVTRTCDVVANKLVTWPVRPLPAEIALIVARTTLENLQPRVGLLKKTPINSVMPNVVQELSVLRSVLKKHGVEIGTQQLQESGYYRAEITPPAAWANYLLPAAKPVLGMWESLCCYKLSESLELKQIDVSQSAEDRIAYRYRVIYKGCSPVCAALKDLFALHGNIAAAQNMFEGGLTPGEWPAEETKTLYFVWYADGWKLENVSEGE